MIPHLDWHGVLSGQPLQWIISGFLTTVWVSVAGMILATVLAVLLLALRLGGGRPGRWLVAAWFHCSAIRRCWSNCCSGILPPGICCRWEREILSTTTTAGRFCGNVWWWLTPEFLCSMGTRGLYLAFLIEEIASGCAPLATASGKRRCRRGLRRGRSCATFCRRRGWLTPGSRLSASI